MNALEQLALGGIGLLRTLEAAWRPALWRPWLPALLAQVAVVGAFAWGAHPALSWFMAPLMDALMGRDVLHYPQLFQKLAPLCAWANLAFAAVLVPLCAGASTRRFAACFGRTPPPGTTARDAFSLVLVGLPAVAAALAVHLALDRVAGVQLSGFTRRLLPPLGALGVTLVQATTFYVFAEVTLARRGALGTLAAIPTTIARGFLPAVLTLALLSLPLLALAVVEPVAASGRWRDLPEAAMAVAVARAFVQTAAWMLAAGVATLVHMGGLVPEGEGW